MIDWPATLIDDIALRRAVICIGAGVSRSATGTGGVHPPLWGEFLARALAQCPSDNKHIRAAIKRGDYLGACEWLRARMDDGWAPFLKKEFVQPKFSASDLHKQLYRLDVRFVLTPNFDKIYDGLAHSESQNTVIIKNYYAEDVAAIFRGNTRAILKIHGNIDDPDKMIFTRYDYARARVQNKTFYNVFDALLLTHTFLFIGCGTSDPDIQLLLENFAFTYSGVSPHYMTLPKPTHSDEVKSLRDSRNIKILGYSPKADHKELLESVTVLADKVDERRLKIASEYSW